MKRMLLVTGVVIGVAAGSGWASAQAQPAAQPQPPAATKNATGSRPSTESSPAAGADRGKLGHGGGAARGKGGMMGGGMMGQGSDGKGGGGGMMAGGMMGMGGMCPMVVGADTKVQVKNLPKGVTITFTNDDAAAVVKLQKMAEAMRLMQEAHVP
jgi:hypothetical protein